MNDCSCDPKPKDGFMFCSTHIILTFVIGIYIGMFLGCLITIVVIK